MRILLTGANGQLGHTLHERLAPMAKLVCATRNGHPKMGFSDSEAADFNRPACLAPLLQRVAPDVVINTAAYTAVDRAESEGDQAFRINAEAVAALAEACAARDTLLVHYSTDYVFPGDDPRPRWEDDPTGPVNVYGASKLAGEEAIRASGCRHLIFRISWLYAPHGHNFLRTMLRLAGERDALRVVDDQIGAPTPAHWIADATAKAIAQREGRSGTWHLAATGETSWHGFAEAIFEEAHRSGLIVRRPVVIPIRSSEYPTPARRPMYSRLDPSRLQSDFGIALRDWRLGLSEVLSALR